MTIAISIGVCVLLLASLKILRMVERIQQDTIRTRESTNLLKWEAIRRNNDCT